MLFFDIKILVLIVVKQTAIIFVFVLVLVMKIALLVVLQRAIKKYTKLEKLGGRQWCLHQASESTCGLMWSGTLNFCIRVVLTQRAFTIIYASYNSSASYWDISPNKVQLWSILTFGPKAEHFMPMPYYGWLRGTVVERRSLRRTFAVLHSTCGRRMTTYVSKPSTVGQPTRPTQPFILSG